jgi:hypothetical protein
MSETSGALYCANHPSVETWLRCNKCNKPICTKCAVQTPVGFRCKECVRTQQAVYFNAERWDTPIAFALSAALTAIATPIVGGLLSIAGFFGLLIAFMLGSGAGSLLAQVIRRAINRRRGRYLGWAAVGGVVCGLLLGSVVALFTIGGFPLFSLPVLLFAILTAVALYQFLR